MPCAPLWVYGSGGRPEFLRMQRVGPSYALTFMPGTQKLGHRVSANETETR